MLLYGGCCLIKLFSQDEISARIEAALYSAGRPLSVDELIRASGTNSREKTLKIITELMKKTKSVFKAIEIDQLEDGSFCISTESRIYPSYQKIC